MIDATNKALDPFPTHLMQLPRLQCDPLKYSKMSMEHLLLLVA